MAAEPEVSSWRVVLGQSTAEVDSDPVSVDTLQHCCPPQGTLVAVDRDRRVEALSPRLRIAGSSRHVGRTAKHSLRYLANSDSRCMDARERCS